MGAILKYYGNVFMNIIILTMGAGTRMKPWTDKKNKALFRVNGEELMFYHLSNIQAFCIQFTKLNAVITASASIQFARYVKLPRFLYGQGRISVYEEIGLLGSGGACKDVFDRYGFDRAVIIYGDTYFEKNIYSLLPELYKNTAKNYIFTEETGKHKNGLIKYNEKTDKITAISERENIRRANGRNAGIMILNKEVFTSYGRKTGDLMKDVLPGRKDLYAFPIEPPGVDIGILPNYIRLTMENYDSPQAESLLNDYANVAIPAIEKILRADRIFLAGNGGSLATANHLALDWSKVGNKQTIVLGNPEHITAYGNDENFENIFVNQLDKYVLSDKDVIVLISTSGDSPNLVKMLTCFKGEQFVAFCGKQGKLSELKYCLPVNSVKTRVIEDAHLCYGHAITEIMEGLI